MTKGEFWDYHSGVSLDGTIVWDEAGVKQQGREEDMSCTVPSPTAYNLECITAVVGPPEAKVTEAKAAGEGAGQQDLRAVDSVDGAGFSHRHLQRQGHGKQEETCVRGHHLA